MTILLDVAITPFLSSTPDLLLGFLIFAILLEAFGLQRAKYGTFKRSLLVALIANIASTIVGWVAFDVDHFDIYIDLIILFFLLSVIIEGAVFYFMNRDYKIGRTLVASATVNAASYLILFAIVLIMRS